MKVIIISTLLFCIHTVTLLPAAMGVLANKTMKESVQLDLLFQCTMFKDLHESLDIANMQEPFYVECDDTTMCHFISCLKKCHNIHRQDKDSNMSENLFKLYVQTLSLQEVTNLINIVDCVDYPYLKNTLEQQLQQRQLSHTQLKQLHPDLQNAIVQQWMRDKKYDAVLYKEYMQRRSSRAIRLNKKSLWERLWSKSTDILYYNDETDTVLAVTTKGSILKGTTAEIRIAKRPYLNFFRRLCAQIAAYCMLQKTMPLVYTINTSECKGHPCGSVSVNHNETLFASPFLEYDSVRKGYLRHHYLISTKNQTIHEINNIYCFAEQEDAIYFIKDNRLYMFNAEDNIEAEIKEWSDLNAGTIYDLVSNKQCTTMALLAKSGNDSVVYFGKKCDNRWKFIGHKNVITDASLVTSITLSEDGHYLCVQEKASIGTVIKIYNNTIENHQLNCVQSINDITSYCKPSFIHNDAFLIIPQEKEYIMFSKATNNYCRIPFAIECGLFSRIKNIRYCLTDNNIHVIYTEVDTEEKSPIETLKAVSLLDKNMFKMADLLKLGMLPSLLYIVADKLSQNKTTFRDDDYFLYTQLDPQLKEVVDTVMIPRKNGVYAHAKNLIYRLYKNICAPLALFARWTFLEIIPRLFMKGETYTSLRYLVKIFL
jgi:hypothetical protein